VPDGAPTCSEPPVYVSTKLPSSGNSLTPDHCFSSIRTTFCTALELRPNSRQSIRHWLYGTSYSKAIMLSANSATSTRSRTLESEFCQDATSAAPGFLFHLDSKLKIHFVGDDVLPNVFDKLIYFILVNQHRAHFESVYLRLFIPEHRADQSLPFHCAMLLAETPPAVINWPPA